MTVGYSAVPETKRPYRPKGLTGVMPWFIVVFMALLAVLIEVLVATFPDGLEVPPFALDILYQAATKVSETITADQAVSKFLSSFVPALFFVPLGFCVASSCRSIKVVQPLINLGKGSCSPNDSILLDYAEQNPVGVVYSSMRRKNHMVTSAALVALGSLLFQPLAGALFQLKSVPIYSSARAGMSGLLQYNPRSLAQPASFLAAAGFSSLNMVSTGIFPSFVLTGDGYYNAQGNDVTGRWVVPPFQYLPDPRGQSIRREDAYLSIRDTEALYIEGACASPSNVSISNEGGLLSVAGSLSETCSSTVPMVGDGDDWVGSMQTADPSCVSAITNSTWDAMPSSLNSSSWPVVFGFSRGGSDGRMAFCVARQSVRKAAVMSQVQGPYLVQVDEVWPHTIIDSSLNGYPLNGINLNQLSVYHTDDDILTDNSEISYLIADSVIQAAGTITNEVEEDTSLQNSTLWSRTSSVCLNAYLDYLAVLSAQLYVYAPLGSRSNTVNAMLTTYKDRIVIFKYAAHTFVALLSCAAILLGWAAYASCKERHKYLRVRNVPGTIAAAAALISQSTVFDGIVSAHSLETIKEKLGNKRFHIDGEKWVIEEDPLLMPGSGALNRGQSS